MIHLDKEGIMAADARQFDEPGVDACILDAFREFPLLVDREQDVGLHADDQCPLNLQLGEAGL